MIQRQITSELKLLMKEYPVVTITGPRQAGKTTLAKSTYPYFSYCNLESPENRELAQKDAKAFFNRFKPPLILDEVQYVPELLSYIQVISDEKNENGLFIVTGSQQLLLNEKITQSLAGRAALLTLLPLTIHELKSHHIQLDRDQYLFKGFMPRIYDKNQDSTKAYRNYLQTYIERDLRQLIQIKDLSLFEVFIKLLAGRVGQLVNLSMLSNEVGVSSKTLNEWLSILEASYMVYRLRPYYENFGKRMIKSSKIYFTDVGLLRYLLGIHAEEQISRDPLFGQIFENLVVVELLKYKLNKGEDPNLYFYRDSNHSEVDVVYQSGRQLIPIEIKSAMTFNKNFAKGIHYFQKITPKATKGFIIYSGDLVFESEDYTVLNFEDTGQVFEKD